MRFLIITAILTLFICIPANANKISIVAVVGEEAITNQDVINKLKISLISSGIESTPENIAMLRPQVLQSLINEKVQIKEGESLGIKVTDAELEDAISTLEQQNNMAVGGLTQLLESNNIPLSVINNQIKAEIIWAAIKSGKIGRKVSVSEEEIDVYLRAKNFTGQTLEYYLHEIVLPVESSDEEIEKLDLAKKLRQEIIEGKDFAKIAQQFSRSLSAKNNGVIGWLNEKVIPKEILVEVLDLKEGQISSPIRSIEGFFLVKYTDKRILEENNDKTQVKVNKFYKKVSNEKEAQQLRLKMANSISDPYNACLNGESYAKENNLNFLDLGMKKYGELDKPTKIILQNTGVGEVSEPFIVKDEVSAFIICERVEDLFPEQDPVAREEAKQLLRLKKVELEARKYMRDLRANTNIEIR